MKRAGVALLTIGLSALLIWLSVRSLDFASVMRALASANYLYFVPICGLTLLAFWLRAVRWGWLLKRVKTIEAGSLFSATMIGFAANNLLPARIGELVRPWALGRKERISRSSALATVIVERVVDMFALLVVLAVGLAFHPFPRWVKDTGFTVLGLSLAALVVLLVIERNPKKADALADWVGRRAPAKIAPSLSSLLRNFAAGLGVLRDGPGLVWVAAYSFLMFAVTALGLQMCAWAFGLSLPWYAGLILLVVTAFGIMVAPTPGYVGAIQFACVVGLELFGVDRATGFSYSIYYHLTQFLPITLVGLYYLGRQGMSLSEVAAASREEVRSSA